MKKIFQLVLIILIVTLTSCEKVIDVAISNSKPEIVIEALITDEPGSNVVKISRTKNYNDSNKFVGIPGAQVRIMVDSITTLLTEKEPGIFTSNLIGIAGKTYKLEVVINGQVYYATSTMRTAVEIQQLHISEMLMGSEKVKYVNAVYQDPQEKGNYFKFLMYINGGKEKEIFTQNDDLTNDRVTTAMLFTHNNDIKIGDTIRVQLQSIDEKVYKYWFSLSQSSTGSGSNASPANPLSNISNGALGYFSAHSVREKQIVVQ